MYKVFFNERQVILTDDFSKHFQVKYGLFYKYRDKEDLKELIGFYSKLQRINALYIFHSDIDELRSAFKDCFTVVNAAGGLVKNTKGEYLFIFRRGKWDLPKGKLDKKETFEQAALREVEEECGITGLKLIKPLISTYHTYEHNKKGIALKKTSWFEMDYSGNEIPTPQIIEDIEEVRWFLPENFFIPMQNCFPMIKDLIQYIGL